ncbi:RNA polymerase sigma factor [Labilithrix luteola]|uniref:RNA polymerase sigma factor n=1 Tax=Labilithrix luteola TaxID=1391654 RepID=UPI001F0A57ED|nr:sigma-70 family RNA polymerase sigma factor [Labilithrix luteola]
MDVPLTGSPDAEAIFREYAPYVHRVLRHLGVASEDIDDVMQDVFIVVHRKVADFEPRGSLRAWVHGIAIRVTSRHRRRRSRVRETAKGDALDAIDPRTPAETLDAQDARRILAGILDQLDDDKRAVFVLYELEELSMQEVAEAAEIPLQTAYSRLRAARELVYEAVRRHQARENFR